MDLRLYSIYPQLHYRLRRILRCQHQRLVPMPQQFLQRLHRRYRLLSPPRKPQVRAALVKLLQALLCPLLLVIMEMEQRLRRHPRGLPRSLLRILRGLLTPRQ